MRIESYISYWKDGFLTYNPEKIRSILFEHFPAAIFDKKITVGFISKIFFKLLKKKAWTRLK